jgi:hypothetical protein
MKVPPWVALIGAVEVLFGAWGLYSVAWILLSGRATDRAAIVGVIAVCAIAIGSLAAGTLVAKRHERAVVPLTWLLALQSIRLAIPGVVWLASLGWTVVFVLYAGGSPQPDGQDIAVLLGSHPLGAHLGLNLLAFIPCLALMIWRRAAMRGQYPAPAV